MGEGLLDLGQTPIVKGRGMSFHMPVAERVRAARGVAQAVVKVRSFAHGVSGVSGCMDYISRGGSIALETESGGMLEGREEQRALVKSWSVDFDKRKDSRDSAHIIFSMPPGSSVEALKGAVRTVGHKTFEGHEWVFAIHQDTKHPHAHMVLKMRGWDKDQKIDFKKADLHKLREAFAEAAREQGVELAASSRAARGVGKKGMSQAIYQMRQKKIVPQVWLKAYREDFMERDMTRERPWEKAMEERNAKEREFYNQDAETLRTQAAAQADLNQRQALVRAAMDLERFAKTMPKPKTRRQMWQEEFEADKKKQVQISKSQKESGWER